MKALLSLLIVAVAGFFGYNHAESIISSRPPADLPPETVAPPQPEPVAPLPAATPGQPALEETTPGPAPAPEIIDGPQPPAPEPEEASTTSPSSLPAAGPVSRNARVSGQSPATP